MYAWLHNGCRVINAQSILLSIASTRLFSSAQSSFCHIARFQTVVKMLPMVRMRHFKVVFRIWFGSCSDAFWRPALVPRLWYRRYNYMFIATKRYGTGNTTQTAIKHIQYKGKAKFCEKEKHGWDGKRRLDENMEVVTDDPSLDCRHTLL